MVLIPPASLRYPFFHNLNLKGKWNEANRTLLHDSVSAFYALNPQRPVLWGWLENIEFSVIEMKFGGLTTRTCIHLNPIGLTLWTIVHELAHAWDASTDWQLSLKMQRATRSHFILKPLHSLLPKIRLFWYSVGSPPPPCGIDKNFNRVEDFAEAVAASILPDEAYERAKNRGFPYEKWGYVRFQDTPRGKFIRDLVS